MGQMSRKAVLFMAWDEQQSQFGRALVNPGRNVPDFIVKSARQPSVKRFNVYRNNVMVSLTEAIRDAYPVVGQLVGEEFATAMARSYAGDNLPQSPVMLEYGEGYADFIDHFEPAGSQPFLADIARLEWAWLKACHSADQQPVSLDALSEFAEGELGGLCFEFCSSVRLLRSDYPVGSIWSAHQGEMVDEEGLAKLSQQPECVLVNRPLWDVEVRVLEPAIYAFFSSLHKGLPLGTSIDKGNMYKGFDPAMAIQALFATRIVARIKMNKNEGSNAKK